MRDIGKLDGGTFSYQDRDNLLTMITYFDNMYTSLSELVQILDGVDLRTLDEHRKRHEETKIESLFKYRLYYKKAEQVLKEIRKRLYHRV